MYRHFSTGISIPQRWQVRTHLTVTDTDYVNAVCNKVFWFSTAQKVFQLHIVFGSTDSCAPTITHDIIIKKFNEGFTHDKPVMWVTSQGSLYQAEQF